MPPRKTASDSPKMLSTRTLVVVSRDQTAATPRTVWAHEIPILEAIFGEGMVSVQEPEALDEGYNPRPSPDLLIYNKQQDKVRRPSETQGLGFVFIGDPRNEFERLCSLYGRHPDVNQPYAEYIFGRFDSGKFEKLVGSPELSDLPDDQLRALATQYGYIPVVGDKASDAEKQAQRDKQLELTNANTAALLKIAEELQVELA